MNRRMSIPDNIPTEQHNTFRNIIEGVNDQHVERIHQKKTLQSLGEGKEALIIEGGNLCRYIKFKGKLYCLTYEPAS